MKYLGDEITKSGVIQRNNAIGKLFSLLIWLFSDSITLTKPQKVGSFLLVLIFAVILSPIASNPSDPYRLQEFSENLVNFGLILENLLYDYGVYSPEESPEGYVVIEGVKYRVLFDGNFDLKNPNVKTYLIPGFDVIKSNKF